MKNKNLFGRKSMAISIFRSIFGLLGKLAPAVAARLALMLYLTPPANKRPIIWPKPIGNPDLSTFKVAGKACQVYIWEGSGPSVLLVHGWGSSAVEMSRFIEPLLTKGFKVVAIDGPTHGNSEGRRVDFMEFSKALADIPGQSYYAVLAHSYGAACSLIALDRYNLKTQKMVLLACPKSAIWATDMFAHQLGIPENVIEIMKKRLVTQRKETWEWKEVGAEVILPKLKLPLLVLHDKDDGAIPYSHAQVLAGIGSNAKLQLVTGTGHRYIIRKQSVIEQCISFLQEEM